MIVNRFVQSAWTYGMEFNTEKSIVMVNSTNSYHELQTIEVVSFEYLEGTLSSCSTQIQEALQDWTAFRVLVTYISQLRIAYSDYVYSASFHTDEKHIFWNSITAFESMSASGSCAASHTWNI